MSYCSQECQRAHWKVHKKTCKISAAAKTDVFLKQARAGDAEAQFNIGVAYDTGTGVARILNKLSAGTSKQLQPAMLLHSITSACAMPLEPVLLRIL